MENTVDKDFLKGLIRAEEARQTDYTLLMEDLGRNKKTYGDDKDFYNWFKAWVRESLNETKNQLKHLQVEMQHLNQGMNPPFCYLRKEHAQIH